MLFYIVCDCDICYYGQLEMCTSMCLCIFELADGYIIYDEGTHVRIFKFSFGVLNDCAHVLCVALCTTHHQDWFDIFVFGV